MPRGISLGQQGLRVSALGLGITLLDTAQMYGRGANDSMSRALVEEPPALHLGLSPATSDSQPLLVEVPSPQGRRLPEPQCGEGRQEHEQPLTCSSG